MKFILLFLSLILFCIECNTVTVQNDTSISLLYSSIIYPDYDYCPRVTNDTSKYHENVMNPCVILKTFGQFGHTHIINESQFSIPNQNDNIVTDNKKKFTLYDFLFYLVILYFIMIIISILIELYERCPIFSYFL